MPPKFLDQVCVCRGCGEKFRRKQQNAGQFCSHECYQTPRHLRRKRGLGTLSQLEMREVIAHAEALAKARRMRAIRNGEQP